MSAAKRQFSSLQEALEVVCGRSVQILRMDPVAGGDINRAYLLNLSVGHKLFMKENAEDKLSLFVREEEGL